MPIASSPTSQFLDAVRQSWILKLVWAWLSLLPLSLCAVAKHGGGHFSFIWFAPLLLLVPPAASLLIGRLQSQAQRKRHRRLTPLQRTQVSDEPEYEPLHEVLAIGSHPPVATLPPLLQAAVARLGAKPPVWLAPFVIPLCLAFGVALAALALLDDPVALLTRGLGRPWPLSYWSTYAIFAAIGFLLVTWHWLRAMHDHYVAEGLNAGRRPFPALRA